MQMNESGDVITGLRVEIGIERWPVFRIEADILTFGVGAGAMTPKSIRDGDVYSDGAVFTDMFWLGLAGNMSTE